MPSPPSSRFFLPWAVLAFVLGSLAAGAGAPPDPGASAGTPSLQDLAAQVAKARSAGHLDEAVGVYRRALARKPSWLEVRLALASLLYDARRFGEARDEFQRVVAARPSDGLTLALKALCEVELREEAQALADFLAARRRGISNPEVGRVASYRAALLLIKNGDPDGAFEVLREFALAGDDRLPVIEALGLAMLRLTSDPEAIPADKREMILLAGRGGYHLARGRRSSLGRLALEELVSRFPSQPNVHYALGSYLLVDEPETAIGEFRRELLVSPDHHVAMIQIALAELKRGHAELALPMAEKAAALAPSVPAGWLALAQALVATGRAAEAVPNAERAVQLAPDNPRLRLALVQAYDAVGRKQDAARERKEFLKLQKGDDQQAEGDSPSARADRSPRQ